MGVIWTLYPLVMIMVKTKIEAIENLESMVEAIVSTTVKTTGAWCTKTISGITKDIFNLSSYYLVNLSRLVVQFSLGSKTSNDGN